MTNKKSCPVVFFRTAPRALLICILTPCLLAGLDAQSRPSPLQLRATSSSELSVTVPLALQKGTALSIALAHRVPVSRKGEPVEGRLVQPVYAFDRIVAPAGCKVLGRITAVRSAPRKERAQAMLHGDFTAHRTATVEFDTLVLKDRRRVPISTAVSPGTTQVVHLEVADAAQGKKAGAVSKAIASAEQQIHAEKNQIMRDVKQPGRMHRLKELLISELPYHPQYLPAGTRFIADLGSSAVLGSARVPALELKRVGTPPAAGSVLEATLVTPLSSAMAHRGSRVEAIVTQPVFSKGHELVIPEGSKLEGTVVQAKPARRMRLHRNGVLRFAFEKIQTPHGIPQYVEGSLAGVDVDKKEKLKLDSEGGARSTTSKMDYAAPAIAVLIAASSAAPDVDVRPGRVYTDTSGPAGGQVLGGGLGYRLIGILTALTMHYQPVTAGFAAYGAAWSVYSHLLSRGQDVVFPKDTPMEIRLGEHRSASPVGAPQPLPHKSPS